MFQRGYRLIAGMPEVKSGRKDNRNLGGRCRVEARTECRYEIIICESNFRNLLGL